MMIFMLVSHCSQPIQSMLMHMVARVAVMDACIQQHGLLLTKSNTCVEYAASQNPLSPFSEPINYSIMG